MTLSALFNYGVEFLPAFAWHAHGSGVKCAFILLFMAGISAFYFLFLWTVRSWFPNRKKKLWNLFSLITSIGIIIGIINFAGFAHSIPFPPIYIFLSFILLGAGMAVPLAGMWLFLKSEGKPVPSLASYLLANLWLYSLYISHFMAPFIIFNMPIFDHSRRVVYLGMPALMLITYLAYVALFLPKLFAVLRLELAPDAIPADCREKFLTAAAPIRERGHQRILVIKPGFRNAIALTSEKKIVVGIDVIRHLEREELQAILFHELGHLEDTSFMPQVRRSRYLMHLCIFLFFLLTYSNVSAFNISGLAVLLLCIYIFSIREKAIRLKAEVFADGFVRNADSSIYPHLISGIEKLTDLNAVDKNYCKNNNVAHLDIDERVAAVENAEAKIKRPKSFWRVAANVLLWGALSFAFTYYYGKLFPSPADRWNELHSKFHKQDNANEHEAALDTIKEAFVFATSEFGKYSGQTYKCLNDLAEFHMRSSKFGDPEPYAIQAVEVGENIYGDADLKFVRSLKNLGEIRFYRGNHAGAYEQFARALQFQERFSDDGWDRANTMAWLIATLEALDRDEEVIRLYERQVRCYAELGEMGRWQHLSALGNFADFLAERKMFERARQCCDEALLVSKQEFGIESGEYAMAVLKHAEVLMAGGDLMQAEKLGRESVKRLEILFGDDSEELSTALLLLGEIYSSLGKTDELASVEQKLRVMEGAASIE